MDVKSLTDRLIDAASTISEKTDYIFNVGEYKMDLRYLNREIDRRYALIGQYIYNWYSNKQIDITEVPRLCREIREMEGRKNGISGKMNSLKKNNS